MSAISSKLLRANSGPPTGPLSTSFARGEALILFYPTYITLDTMVNVPKVKLNNGNEIPLLG